MFKGTKNYIRMTTAPTASEAASKLISSDLKEIGDATMKLADHVMKLGVTGGFINTSLQCFACFVVIYLLLLDRTNWRTNISSVLLLPYILLTYPNWLFENLHFAARYVRSGWIGVLMCLSIGFYLLQEHIRASGGFRNAFTKSNGISNSMGIFLLFFFPVWVLIGLL
ncbi:cold-regulated 413 plasma membrane protein 2 isoform X2 [Lactuca sativa]|uniref:cold-regulated 413 plasma membrane protein 2 isoform X2 n=1 Tax=Lactuca sativa TaxID=4236 RepID=UPI000CD81F95|nr:cold-regulated 413 plasma membrane protein 2 isoform X2 [Lactuca sativa]